MPLIGEDAPSVTVVVVTWSNVGGLQRCLDSLEGQSLPRPNYRVLVVDNDSRDGSADLLQRHRGRTGGPFDVLRLPVNAGFAGGVSAALAHVGTPFVVLLNDDAAAEPGMLAALLGPLGAPGRERVAAVTGLVLLDDPLAPARSPRGVPAPGVLLDNAGWPFVPAGDPRADGPALARVNSTGNQVRLDGNAQDRDWLRPAGPGHAVVCSDPEVFGFCGAAVALRASAVAAVGGMDAGLFLYWEDTDLSWRLRRAGWQVRFEAGAVARHQHAASSGGGSATARFYNERNRLVVLTRYAPAAVAVATLLRYAARTVIWSLRGRAAAGPRWRVLTSYARRIPGDLRRRRDGERGAVVPRRQLARWLVPVPPADTPPA